MVVEAIMKKAKWPHFTLPSFHIAHSITGFSFLPPSRWNISLHGWISVCLTGHLVVWSLSTLQQQHITHSFSSATTDPNPFKYFSLADKLFFPFRVITTTKLCVCTFFRQSYPDRLFNWQIDKEEKAGETHTDTETRESIQCKQWSSVCSDRTDYFRLQLHRPNIRLPAWTLMLMIYR